jgi:hypothetical protein
MAKSARKFRRPCATRNYKKVFHIFTEGCETEPRYFAMIGKFFANNIHLSIKYRKTRPQPLQILKYVKKFIRDEKLKKDDEVWIIVDVDDRNKTDFQPLHQWAAKKENYGLAISNPCFEYWLLLHFEEGHNICGLKHCLDRLKTHLPNYEKSHINEEQLKSKVYEAIDNAKNRYISCNKELFNGNCTTVHFLVEKIAETNNYFP